MKTKQLVAFMAVWLLQLAVGIQAAPASSYQQFLAGLDGIQSGAMLPVADPAQIAARMPVGFLGGVPGAASGQSAEVLQFANDMLGRPVVWGGASPSQGFDCSGLVQYVYRQAGITLPRTADLQFLVGQTVAVSALQPGDLLYYTTYEPGASHVGIYIGSGKMIHTSFSKGIVTVADINDSYFIQRFYGAKRVLS